MKPITLKTKRLILRRSQEQDADALFINYLSSPERSHFLCRKPHADISQTRDFIKSWCDLPWENEQNKFAWVIANKNEAIGLFLVECDNNHGIEIHYGISKKFENQGLMTEAGLAVVQWLSKQNKANKIYAHCALENLGSQAVLKNLGFKREGILKNHLILPALASSPQDCFLFTHASPKSEDLS
jgi:ribosomal-protein-alanine N-acetyltransferase